jgi:glycosyltransferase involved in cell wall biosynthesis
MTLSGRHRIALDRKGYLEYAMAGQMTTSPTRFSSHTAVVIPTYRQSQYLPQAIASALANAETSVVVVSDGCPDEKTRHILSSCAYTQSDRFVGVETSNRGPSAARNFGIQTALSLNPDLDYVFLLDSDNYIEADTIDRLKAVLDSAGDASWAYPNLHHFGQRNGLWSPPKFSRIRQMFTNHSDTGSLIRASVFRSGFWFDERMRKGLEDWEFFMRLTLGGHIGVAAGSVGFHYRARPMSITTEAIATAQEVFNEMHKDLLGVQPHARLLELESIDKPRFGISRECAKEVISVTNLKTESFSVDNRNNASPSYSVETSQDVVELLRRNRLLPGFLYMMQLWSNQCGGSSLFLVPSNRDDEIRISKWFDLDLDSALYPVPQGMTSKRMVVQIGQNHCSSDEFQKLLKGTSSLHLSYTDFSKPQESTNQVDVECLAPFIRRIPWAAKQTELSITFVVPWLGLGGVDACVIALARELRNSGTYVHLVITDDPRIEVTSQEIGIFETVTFVPTIFTVEERMEALIGAFSCAQVVINAHSALCYETFKTHRHFLTQQHCAYLHVFDVDPSGQIVGFPSIAASNLGSIDSYLCISQQMIELVHSLGVPKERAHLIPNSPIVPVQGECDSKSEAESTRPLRILFAGRLDRQKGLERLARVIELTDSSRFSFEIRGDVGIDPVNQDVIANILQKTNVSFGPAIIDRRELSDTYRSADIFLHLTRWEGVPLAVLDAMASGCVVVATDVGAISEVVINKQNGMLIDVDAEEEICLRATELLGQLCDDRGWMTDLQKEAIATATDLTWANSARKILKATGFSHVD